MKIRQGFVSNSSSSSFIVKIDNTNKHLINYDWKVRVVEYLYEEDEETFDFYKEVFRPKKDILEEENFVFDELATKEYNDLSYNRYNSKTKVYSKIDNINKINGIDLSRYTGIAIGKDILEFIEAIEQYEGHIEDCKVIRSFIEEYGIENFALIRESDEDYGGNLPKELAELQNKCLYEFEYH